MMKLIDELFTEKIQKMGGQYHGRTWHWNDHKAKVHEYCDFGIHKSHNFLWDIRLIDHFWSINGSAKEKWSVRDKIIIAIDLSNQEHQTYVKQLSLFEVKQ